MTRAVALLAGLLLGSVALLPARLVLPAPPLAADTVSGSVWRAALGNAALGPARLGDLALALQPSALLQGRVQWQATGALGGVLWRSLAGGGVQGLSGSLGISPMAGVPVSAITLAGVEAGLDGRGRCQSASGQVQAQLGVALAGQTSLAGALRCEGAALALPLASADGRVRLELSITSGGWSSRLLVNGAGPAEASALAAAGFRADAGGLAASGGGQW